MTIHLPRLFLFSGLFLLAVFVRGAAQTLPATDSRLGDPRHLDLTYSFPNYPTKQDWLARAAQLRQQILASAGLLPAPPKTPIKAVIFGKVDRGDHTIEKVYFESYPGFYVTGNLYRPKNASGPSKLPAVLCPHGHWAYGRLENTALNSGPARAISFARQGYVAFSYDMVGYVDNVGISHKFADHNLTGREALWGVNLLGLQLWNSIRSIDFLLTLPEVDADRIACTGESGGGTQTFLIAAVDERVKVAAPVNMVSFLMQGGSLCENAPNLRIDANNVEIAALMAPRPMILVSATGDWTKNMLTSEYPAVKSIYRLFGAEDKVTAIQVNAPHNYNQESREAVYGWFAHWMQGRPETTPFRERGVSVPSLSEMLVFFGRQRPENELNEAQLTDFLIKERQKQIGEALTNASAGSPAFKELFGPALEYSLMAEYPKEENLISEQHNVEWSGNVATKQVTISRRGRGDLVQLTIRESKSPDKKSFVLVLSGAEIMGGPGGAKDKSDRDRLIASLIQAGYSVATINLFPAHQDLVASKYKFFTTYNRTDAANRIQDILTATAFLKQLSKGKSGSVHIVGMDQAGSWALLARGLMPEVGKTVIDAAQFDTASDDEYLKRLPIPGIRRAGDFTTAVAMAPLAPLRIHNTGDKFQTSRFAEIYRRSGREANFQSQQKLLSADEILSWLSAK